MGRITRFGVGVCVVTVSPPAAAQGTPTGTFPPARSSAADSAAAPVPSPLPPPPAPPPALAAPAPAPAPAAAAPLPPGYPAPYPGYAPPPPGYAYYYPPQPRVFVQSRLPRDAAVSSSPFLDLLVTSVSWQNRFSEFLDVGLQGGVYLAGRVRLTANVLFPTSALTDSYDPDYSAYLNTGYYYARQPSKSASVIFGVGLGIVAVSTPNFLMSPGLVFNHTDVSDYGSSLAAAFPFEWVTGDGVRLGFEFDAGRAIGGSYHEQCFSNSGAPGNGCASSAQLTLDRPAGTSIVLQFQVGFGFNHPDPLPSKPEKPEHENYGDGWPAAPPAPAPSPAPAVPASSPVVPGPPPG